MPKDVTVESFELDHTMIAANGDFHAYLPPFLTNLMQNTTLHCIIFRQEKIPSSDGISITYVIIMPEWSENHWPYADDS